MGLLSKEQILEAQDLQVLEVPVPEWGGSVLMRALSAVEMEGWQNSVNRRKNKDGVMNMKGITASLLQKVIVEKSPADGTLVPMFTESDLNSLSNKSSKASARLLKIAMEMNGVDEKDLEGIRGNSPQTQEGGGGSE